MDSDERRMDPVAIIIINLQKKLLAEPVIEPATSSSQVLYAYDRAVRAFS